MYKIKRSVKKKSQWQEKNEFDLKRIKNEVIEI